MTEGYVVVILLIKKENKKFDPQILLLGFGI